MKKMVVFFLASLFVFSAYGKFMVGQVDIQKVLLTVNEGVSVKNELKKTFDKKQGILKKDEEEIKKQQEDYKKQILVMNDKAKAKKEQQIQEMLFELQKKTMGFQKEIQDMEQNLKGPILDKIKEIVDAVSKKEGVDATFEVSSGALVFAKEAKDLTDAVIKSYNEKYPGK